MYYRLDVLKHLSVLLLVLGFAITAPQPANALGIKLFGQELKIPTYVDVEVRNTSNKPILVVMDRGREKHLIAPKGKATFRKARILDNPTLHVRDPKTGANLKSVRVGILTKDKKVNV